MEFDEIPDDEMPEPFEDDLEEFERNQVAADHEGDGWNLAKDRARRTAANGIERTRRAVARSRSGDLGKKATRAV